MNQWPEIIVLVGLPGAGKSTIAARVCPSIKAQHVTIEAYRDVHAQPSEIAGSLAALTKSGTVVFECSGASSDFEQILHELSGLGISSFVVGVHASLSTALQRVTARRPYSPPKGSQNWISHLEWTLVRLGLVPTNLDIDTDDLSAAQAAEAVISACRNFLIPIGARVVIPSLVTFSKLSKWQVCGREYAYIHIWRVPPPLSLPSIVGIGQAVHEALAWLLEPQSPQRSLAALLAAYEAKASMMGIVEPKILARGGNILAMFYSAHYAIEAERSLAVEQTVSLPLTATSSFVGQLDLLSSSLSGELEITEFKLHQTRRGSRPRLPDMLQPAAYAVAAMADRRATRAFVRLQYLEEDQSMKLLLTEDDIPRIRRALIRWMQSLVHKGLAANPGHHCQRCAFRTTCPSSLAIDG